VTEKWRCDWPGCEERTEQWFTDGWTVGGGTAPDDGVPERSELVSGLPAEWLLCPRHARALEVLEEQPPTNSTQ
jgi:hypothetical protein